MYKTVSKKGCKKSFLTDGEVPPQPAYNGNMTQNFLGQTDCSILLHKISPKRIIFWIHFLHGSLVSLLKPTE